MGEEVQEEHRCRLAVRMLGRVVDQGVVSQKLGQAAGVVQGLGERHLPPCRRQLWQQLRHRVVQRQLVRLDQGERDRATERLRRTCQPHPVRVADRLPRAELGHAGGVNLSLRPALHDHDRPGRPVRHRHQATQLGLQVDAGLRRAGRLRDGRAAGQRGAGDDRADQDGPTPDHRGTSAICRSSRRCGRTHRSLRFGQGLDTSSSPSSTAINPNHPRNGRRSPASSPAWPLISSPSTRTSITIRNVSPVIGQASNRSRACASWTPPDGTPRGWQRAASSRYAGASTFEDLCQAWAGVHPQLAVHAREVKLDGLRGDEQRLRDLAVAVTLGGQLGDAPLARGQRIRAGERIALGASPGCVELGPRSVGDAVAHRTARRARGRVAAARAPPRPCDRAAARTQARPAPWRARAARWTPRRPPPLLEVRRDVRGGRSSPAVAAPVTPDRAHPSAGPT